MLFNEVIRAYSDDHMKPTDTFCRQNKLLNVKVSGIYSYRCFKGSIS